MVSADHFAHELRTQLRNAAEQGATTIVITSGELCKSIRDSGHSTQACCDAMQAEVKPGDTVLVSASGAGMTVRYRLPRTAVCTENLSSGVVVVKSEGWRVI